jgi:hypothetical protein
MNDIQEVYVEIYKSIEKKNQLAIFHEHIDEIKYVEFGELSYLLCTAYIGKLLEKVV